MKLLPGINFFTALMVASAVPVYSHDEEASGGCDFTLSGYYRNIIQYQKTDSFHRELFLPPEEKRMLSDMNRLRLSPGLDFGEAFLLRADIDLFGVISNYNGTPELEYRWVEPGYNDMFKLSRRIIDRGAVYSTVEARNIYAKIVLGSFTGTVGRQQVRFGSSRLWNPLDLMNPVNPVSLEGADTQRGIDALRIDWYPGESTELTAVAGPRRQNDNRREMTVSSGSYIMRLKTGVMDCDFALLSGYTAKRKNFGSDFALEFNKGLLTGALLYSDPERGNSFYQCGAGYEYTFLSGIYFLAEYFYNSLPVNESGELRAAIYGYMMTGMDQRISDTISNRIITYNKHYVSVASGYDFFPLLRGEVFFICDLQGRGLFINCSLRLNASQNTDLKAGVMTAYVDQETGVSDFAEYDSKPEFYASVQFYF